MKVYRSIIFLLVTTCLFAAGKVAVTTKVSGKVSIEVAGKNGFNPLKAGTIIADGDKIKTGNDGFAAIIYIDDKSMVKVKENTEIVIQGKRNTGFIAKKVNIDEGTLRAQVSEQRKGDFIVQSATSVASVKGTDFWFISDELFGDIVIGVEGLVNLLNSESGESSDVSAGNTGTSTLDGNVDTNVTNPSDIPSDPDQTGAVVTQIEIQMVGPNGETKTLLIEIQ